MRLENPHQISYSFHFMRKIALEQLKKSLGKELNDLPFVILKRGKPIASVIPNHVVESVNHTVKDISHTIDKPNHMVEPKLDLSNKLDSKGKYITFFK